MSLAHECQSARHQVRSQVALLNYFRTIHSCLVCVFALYHLCKLPFGRLDEFSTYAFPPPNFLIELCNRLCQIHPNFTSLQFKGQGHQAVLHRPRLEAEVSPRYPGIVGKHLNLIGALKTLYNKGNKITKPNR
jgi:hypothetical protein